MKVVFRRFCEADLKWFRYYYDSVFPAGAVRAKTRLASIYQTLKAHPLIGHPVVGVANVHEFNIPNTPFSLIYTVNDTEIMVLRILDNRAHRPTVF
ncbi:MAG: type II toxin-antitoxin system RelE/ParE family toxin [Alphaproteobacteria bacterium]|nr:type II toxin-antitoxin system RelE/ParE family toxin [Alphaproteobacteria bacterium]